ncbi:MAG TPA: hypothetical protein VLR27_07515 [Acidimicrobiales bacterium]|nr:hypothetical protein [Acidimicrobiales bacterium]
MTDSPTPAEPGPVDPDVELASAHLDGEAGAEERDRVDDPAVQAHRSAFGAVADQVRDVPPPPPGLLDDHVAAAMGAFDDDARVVPLAGRGSTRSWWQRIPFGAVAAGLVIVALIVGIATTTDDDDDTDTAATALDSSGTEDAGDEALSDDGEASAGAGMEESLESQEQFDTSGERMAYDSVDALVEDVRTRLPVGPDDPDAGAEAEADDTPVAESDPTTTQTDRSVEDGDEGAVDPCDAVSLLGLDPADVVLVLPAVLTPDEVTVVVHDADDGRRLTVVDDASCTTALDRLL